MEPQTAAPSSIINEEERSKAEYSINGVTVKDLFAVKSTLTKEEIHWMIAALENCKIHCMGIAKLIVGGANQGFCGASIVSEINFEGVRCHFIRCIDLNAFNPLQSTFIEQQLYPGFHFTRLADAHTNFHCKSRQIHLHWKDIEECEKFVRKVHGCLLNLAPQTTAGNAKSKINCEDAGTIDPALADAIQYAESLRPQKVDKNGGFLADGLADIIAQARAEASASKQERTKRTNPQPAAAPRQQMPPAQQRNTQQMNPMRGGPGGGSPRNTPSQYNSGGAPRGTPSQYGGVPSRAPSAAYGGPPSMGTPSQYGGVPSRPPPGARNLRAESPSIYFGDLPATGPVQAQARPVRAATETTTNPPVIIAQPNRPTRAGSAANPIHMVPQVMPRESKIIAWQDKVNRPTAEEGVDVILKIQLVKLGGTKTMKFKSTTLVKDAIKRIASQCSVDQSAYGIFRRSGLPLDKDKTFAELGVFTNDVLDFKQL